MLKAVSLQKSSKTCQILGIQKPGMIKDLSVDGCAVYSVGGFEVKHNHV